MNLKLAVFDMAGTTVHDDDAVHTHFAQALGCAGVQATRNELNAVMGLPKPEAIRLVLESRVSSKADISAELVSSVHRLFLRCILDYYQTSSDVREVTGTTEILRRLRRAGVKTVLDTGFSRSIAEAILARIGWEEAGLLDAVVTSDDVPRGRPWPDMIYRAMALTDVTDPRSVAKIGDTPSDLREGTAAGCGWVIGVTGGSHTAEELQRCPHTHLIGSVADLGQIFELNAAFISVPFEQDGARAA